MKTYAPLAFLVAGLLAQQASSAPRVPQEEIDATIRQEARYTNTVGSLVAGQGVTPFSGQVGGGVSDGEVFLQRSALGLPMAPSIGASGQSASVIDSVRRKLYHEFADESGPDGKEFAAFRYKVLLYRREDADNNGEPDPDGRIRAHYEDIATLYGPAERARVLEAERTLRSALTFSPLDEEVQRALLDLHFDRAVAELQYAKVKLDELNQLRLTLGTGVPSDSTIPEEVALITDPDGVLAIHEGVLEEYRRLLDDGFGFQVSLFDSSYSPRTPLGYYLYGEVVPGIPMAGATYLDNDGNVAAVPVPGVGGNLAPSHRELHLLMGVLRDYGSAATDAARLLNLLASPSNPDDPNREAARLLVGDALQRVYHDGLFLREAFPDLDPDADPTSGLADTFRGWESAVRELNEMAGVLDGRLNPLGFQSDFLVLTAGFGGGDPQFFDSYNTLATWIIEETEPPVRPLSIAAAEFERAQDRYFDYRGYEDQLETELFELKQQRDRRAFELVGAIPGSAEYNPGNPTVGRIADQRFNIEAARNQIELNRREINNVYAEIQIEIERRGIEAGVNNAIAQVQVEYGNKRADLREEIGHWRAAQATAQAASDMIGNIFAAAALGPAAAVAMGFSVVVGAVNGGVQAGGEVAIAEKEAQLERYSALEASRITALQDDIREANSAALIKTLLLRIATLSIESRQAQLTLRQEFGRLAAMYNELAEIERFYGEAVEFSSGRLHADPIHYLRTQEAVKRANESFREAQDWIFYTARALEYKWNKPFVRTVGDRTWSIPELFRTRTAHELTQMLAAMELYDGAQSFGPGTGTNTDNLSLREEILFYRDLDNQGQPILHLDPVTGELVRAREAFRSYLRTRLVTRDNGDQVLVIPFSTVFSPPGSQFYLGPTFTSGGAPVDLGTWLDKIQWLKINIPGSMLQGGFINAFLSDGGSQLIRNQSVGSYDPSQPDRVRNDTTAYSSRLWFTQDGGESFEFRERLRAPIRAGLGRAAGVTDLPDVPENTFFRERSVANTEWTLELTIFDADGAPGGL